MDPAPETIRTTKKKKEPTTVAPVAEGQQGSIPPGPPSHLHTYQVPVQQFYHPYYGHMPFPTYGSPMCSRHQPNHQSNGDTTSSDNMDDPIVYPQLTTWFEELDSGPRGSDGHNFSQYAASLEESSYK